jgi:TonB family protein
MHRRCLRVLPLASLLCLGTIARSSDVDVHLRNEYQNKMLILRSFYSGNSLHFDSEGNLREPAIPGDWTVEGVVRVEDVSVSGDRLRIRGSRLHLGWDRTAGLEEVHDYDGQKPDKNEKKNRSVQIDAELSTGGATAEAADAAFARIFLSSQDSFADLVPDYWKPCVRTAVGVAGDEASDSCRFSAELLAVPGVAIPGTTPPPDSRANPAAPREIQHLGPTRPPPQAPPDGVFHVGRGVTAPRVVSQPGVEFTEYARRAKFQGVVTLKLVVDRSGDPTNVRILSPLGCGLDAQAVRTVKSWKFNPGTKEGEPVAVEIAVETDFHLY